MVLLYYFRAKEPPSAPATRKRKKIGFGKQDANSRGTTQVTSLVAPAIMEPNAIVRHMYQFGVSFSPVTSVNKSKVEGCEAA